MDYIRKSARIFTLQSVRNEEFRQQVNAKETIIERKDKKGLKWFGHLLRINDGHNKYGKENHPEGGREDIRDGFGMKTCQEQ